MGIVKSKHLESKLHLVFWDNFSLVIPFRVEMQKGQRTIQKLVRYHLRLTYFSLLADCYIYHNMIRSNISANQHFNQLKYYYVFWIDKRWTRLCIQGFPELKNYALQPMILRFDPQNDHAGLLIVNKRFQDPHWKTQAKHLCLVFLISYNRKVINFVAGIIKSLSV